jgi:hypothetical protein
MKMRLAAFEGKHMFNKGLISHGASRRGIPAVLKSTKKEPRKSGSQELTGRRQTKWLQPLSQNPDNWMHTVNARKA